MFNGCNKLESIDLSYFNTSLVNDMTSMFSSCNSLKVLDISHFNLENITNSEGIFNNVKILTYINLYHVKDKYKIIQSSKLSDIDNLMVCQKEEEILSTNTNNKKRECRYFNITKDVFGSDNYIIIYYGEESVYKNGFYNKYRDNVSFIINGNYINTLQNDQSFKVNAGCKMELYFNSILTSLESFFDYNHDINVRNIKSIDLSHFNTSLI